MFDGFANVWTPVFQSRHLKKLPVGITIAGTGVALFRTKSGAPAALLDRCPHRGAKLSLGHLREDGCLQCPFHGWRFDETGKNMHVPFNPDAKREHLSALSVPVREIGDLIWIYTAPVKQAPTEPNVPQELIDPGMTRTYLEKTWACHWTRTMENMLDSPHLPFVHRTTIGRSMAARMREDSVLEMTWEETDFGGRQRSKLDGEGGLAYLDFFKPNMMSLHIPIPGKRFTIHALVIPVEAHTTRLLVVGARDWMRPRLLNPFFNKTNGIIANQDQPVVESQSPPEIPTPSQEHSVASDKPTLGFRKYYYEALAKSSAAIPGRPAPLPAAS